MRRARLAPVLLAAVVALVLGVVLTSGDDGYRLRIPLQTASGLEDGSAVQIAGIDRGRVELHLERGDRVVADVELEKGAGPVGRNASARIVAANFLGRKRVVLDPGDAAGDPAPSGWTMPAGRVQTPTDLDQVLGVFDADTRTRAQILLTEAGEAVVGRKLDIRELFARFPIALDDATAVLRAVRTDSATMHDLVERSDRVVADVTGERRRLSRLVDTVGQTARTVSARRAELRDTLAKAPATLRSLRGFLAELERTTQDLGPAARELTAAAPAVAGTLREVDGFRRAAGPTLDEATAAAPRLVRLASGATPVLRRARPAVQALSALGRDLPPVSDALDGSADNIIASLENWSRAIQFRDGLSHVFRGEASWSPDLILSAVERLTKGKRKQARRPERVERLTPQVVPKPSLPKTPKDLLDRLPKLPKAVNEALNKLVEPTAQELKHALGKTLDPLRERDAGSSGDGLGPLLDFLFAP